MTGGPNPIFIREAYKDQTWSNKRRHLKAFHVYRIAQSPKLPAWRCLLDYLTELAHAGIGKQGVQNSLSTISQIFDAEAIISQKTKQGRFKTLKMNVLHLAKAQNARKAVVATKKKLEKLASKKKPIMFQTAILLMILGLRGHSLVDLDDSNYHTQPNGEKILTIEEAKYLPDNLDRHMVIPCNCELSQKAKKVKAWRDLVPDPAWCLLHTKGTPELAKIKWHALRSELRKVALTVHSMKRACAMMIEKLHRMAKISAKKRCHLLGHAFVPFKSRADGMYRYYTSDSKSFNMNSLPPVEVAIANAISSLNSRTLKNEDPFFGEEDVDSDDEKQKDEDDEKEAGE